MGLTLTWLSVIVLIPLAGLFIRSFELSPDQFWGILTSRRTLNALKTSFGLAFAAACVNLVMGTIIVWALVRYRFPGRRLFDAVVDIPFALPTAVAGVALSALFAEKGFLGAPLAALGIKVAFTPIGIFVAMIFIGIPFVVRTVQPVLLELDLEAEEAARSLGAGEFRVFRSIVLPNILPGVLSGVALAFARAVGEIGALVLIAGNTPFKTEVASVFVFLHIQGGDQAGASAVAVVMLLISFALLLAIGGLRFLATRHERA
jgi:sulfate transport system permease protein